MNGENLWNYSVVAIIGVVTATVIGRHLMRMFGKGGGGSCGSCCSSGECGPVRDKSGVETPAKGA
ncbi:MAG: hypothetical protein HQL37_01795 [Alphaproteobacteria bacterium]|nr:hypothetical protein [Alphaproteobacteria bacterium]